MVVIKIDIRIEVEEEAVENIIKTKHRAKEEMITTQTMILMLILSVIYLIQSY